MLDDGPITGRGYKNEQEVIKTLLKPKSTGRKTNIKFIHPLVSIVFQAKIFIEYSEYYSKRG
jgi:hypothetical protein